jgi:predicted DNA-binding transcriptional regulator YafY
LEKHFIESEKLLIEPSELVSIHIAEQLMAPLSHTKFGTGLVKFLEKIKKLLPTRALDYFSELDENLYIKSSKIKKDPHENTFLDIIQKAINEQKVFKLTYETYKKNFDYNTFCHPYGMLLYEGNLYLIGYSEQAEGIRTFKLQRVKDVKLTNKTFRRPEDFSLEGCFSRSFGIFHHEIKPTTVRCVFKNWAARILREQMWHRTQVIEKDEEDKIIVSFLLDSTTDFKKWILGFGPLAYVIEPKKFRDEIEEELRKSLANYRKSSTSSKR